MNEEDPRPEDAVQCEYKYSLTTGQCIGMIANLTFSSSTNLNTSCTFLDTFPFVLSFACYLHRTCFPLLDHSLIHFNCISIEFVQKHSTKPRPPLWQNGFHHVSTNEHPVHSGHTGTAIGTYQWSFETSASRQENEKTQENWRPLVPAQIEK